MTNRRERWTRRGVFVGGLGLAVGGIAISTPSLAQGWKGKRMLVAYYSRTGHTRTIAEMIHGQTGGGLVEIETVEQYPDDYNVLVAQNVREQQANFLPPLKTRIENLGGYDIVFMGSPLWNVRLTPPVRSFVASHKLADMVVAPFVTYIVSGLGRSHADIAENAPNARVHDGLAILGAEAKQAQAPVAKWLESTLAVT